MVRGWCLNIISNLDVRDLPAKVQDLNTTVIRANSEEQKPSTPNQCISTYLF